MQTLKDDLRKVMQNYSSAATHATTLFNTVQQLCHINVLYEYEFEWFVRVFKLSIENSNKSKILEKRLRYLKDHLTYSLFCQVSNSLWQVDRMTFAFLLCCRLLISEERLQIEAFHQLAIFLDTYQSQRQVEEPAEPKPDLYWISEECWRFFLQYEAQFPSLKGTYILYLNQENSCQCWKIEAIATQLNYS